MVRIGRMLSAVKGGCTIWHRDLPISALCEWSCAVPFGNPANADMASAAHLHRYPCIYCGPTTKYDFDKVEQDNEEEAYHLMDNFKAALANKCDPLLHLHPTSWNCGWDEL
jgi:hypothetical protein